MSICPRDSVFMNHTFEPIRLQIVRDDAVKSVPDLDIQVNDLASGRKQFQNNSGMGDTFEVSVFIDSDDRYYGSYEQIIDEQPYESGRTYTVWELLDGFARNLTPVNIVTRAVDVPNGMYVIVDNSAREQSFEGKTIWSLKFMKYETIANTVLFTANSSGVDAALKKYQKAKDAKKAAAEKKKKEELAKALTALKKELRKCKRSVMVYSTKKKTVECVKTLQKYLNKKISAKLKVDGWYNTATKAAVKKYQIKYKDYDLKATGNMDVKTYNLMSGQSNQIGKTITLKSNLPKANSNSIVNMTGKSMSNSNISLPK